MNFINKIQNFKTDNNIEHITILKFYAQHFDITFLYTDNNWSYNDIRKFSTVCELDDCINNNYNDNPNCNCGKYHIIEDDYNIVIDKLNKSYILYIISGSDSQKSKLDSILPHLDNIVFNYLLSLDSIRFNKLESLINHFYIVDPEDDSNSDTIVSMIKDIFNNDKFSIMILKDDTLKILYSAGMDKNIVDDINIPIGTGIAGQVAETGEAILYNPAIKQKKYQLNKNPNYIDDSFLSVPIKNKDKIYGVINLNNKKDNNYFNIVDLKLAVTLSNIFGFVFERKEHLKEINKKLTVTQHERNKFNHIVNRLDKGLVITDENNIIQFVNPVLCSFFLEEPDYFISCNIEDLFDDARQDILNQLLNLTIENPYFVYSNKEYMFNNEHYIINTETFIIKDTKNNIQNKVLLIQNITQEYRLQKIAAYQSVARQLAHEIKNPLTPIKIAVEQFLDDDFFDDEDYKEIIQESAEMIIGEINRLTYLLNEFSAFAKLPGPKLAEVNIVDLLKKTIKLYDNISNIKFDVNINTQNNILKVDPYQIEQVFINIIKNSIEAIGNNNGLIRINILELPDKKNILIDFADNGPGLPEHIQNKVFEPYFTTKPDGTGLGLTIISKIIYNHNGVIKLKNIKNKGVIVSILLPRNA